MYPTHPHTLPFNLHRGAAFWVVWYILNSSNIKIVAQRAVGKFYDAQFSRDFETFYKFFVTSNTKTRCCSTSRGHFRDRTRTNIVKEVWIAYSTTPCVTRRGKPCHTTSCKRERSSWSPALSIPCFVCINSNARAYQTERRLTIHTNVVTPSQNWSSSASKEKCVRTARSTFKRKRNSSASMCWRAMLWVRNWFSLMERIDFRWCCARDHQCVAFWSVCKYSTGRRRCTMYTLDKMYTHKK